MDELHKLRIELERDQSEASRFVAFCRLLKHPDITWNDLIGCLRYPVLVREQASMLLYQHLEVTWRADSFNTDPGYWLEILATREIDPNRVIGKTVKWPRFYWDKLE